MTLRIFMRMGAAAAALIFTTQANAADLSGGFKSGPAAFSAPMWTGFYWGVNGGYAWRQTDDQFGYPACTTPPCGTSGVTAPYPAYNGIGAQGGFGGGQIGYNWQNFLGTPSLVAGIEADIQGAGISGSGTTLSPLLEHYKTNLDWFGTVRGRLGYAAGNTLVYFTGGFAFGGLKQHGEDNTFAPTVVYESSGTVTGYVLGGGLEYKFNPSWSLKAEYQYLNFGKNDPSFVSGDPTAPATLSADSTNVNDDAYHTVRVGLNYWVNPAYQPLK